MESSSLNARCFGSSRAIRNLFVSSLGRGEGRAFRTFENAEVNVILRTRARLAVRDYWFPR